MSKKKSDGFNTPFANLKQLVKKEEAKPPASKAGPVSRKPDVPQSSSDEERSFLDAMAGVAPISKRHALPVNVPQINARIVSEEAEALAQLYDLVSSRGEFEVSSGDGFVRGSAPGVDARLLRALERGDYSHEARLDLHGVSKDVAKDAVDRFLTDGKREGKRCVLIVHRKEIPALSEQLTVWLERGRMGTLALAFCTARPDDGGASGMYVLLRR